FPPPRVVPQAGEWNASYWLTMLLMWLIMMIAMMLPSAAPMILLHARVSRHAGSDAAVDAALGSAAAFAAGYLACWLGFSVFAVAVQYALESTGLLDGMRMWSVNAWLTGALLLAAAIYQLSPLKSACLGHCRSPAAFLAHHLRPGPGGSFRMGLVH